MARTGVAILREIAMVKSSAPKAVREQMLAELHAELTAIYKKLEDVEVDPRQGDLLADRADPPSPPGAGGSKTPPPAVPRPGGRG